MAMRLRDRPLGGFSDFDAVMRMQAMSGGRARLAYQQAES